MGTPGAIPIGTYFEAHIEQGPVLEDNDVTIGVVNAVLGIKWYDCAWCQATIRRCCSPTPA